MITPTQQQIEAAAKALHEMLSEDHSLRGCEHMASKDLSAAAEVGELNHTHKLLGEMIEEIKRLRHEAWIV